MIKVKKEGILLEKTDLEFENEGVLNPAAVREGDCVHLFYRAVRKGNNSTIGYCKLDGPLTVSQRSITPIITPKFEYETQGVEDARISKIDGLYYLTYTGYDGTNARGALATSKDLKHFSKKGIIVPLMTYAEFVFLAESSGKVNENYYRNHKFYYQEADPDKKIMLWDKDLIFFPRRIEDNLVFLHRIRPGIQIVSVKNLEELTKEFWEKYFLNLQDYIVLDPLYEHESLYIGGGCPPIETEHGWLLIYHGVKETKKGLVYSACAALLDLNDPSKEITRLPYPLFFPEYEWELNGEVNNVVFPTGTALFGETLFIYYGAADERIACASVNLQELLSELLVNIIKDEK
jgi:beta-1,2-mannobiose phosphorylase / 1,2-beta-oligomannan phosphorylase